MKLFVVLAVMAAATSCSVGQPAEAGAAPARMTATVLRVIDGDTLDVVDDERGRLRVRVIGLDTPETKKPAYTVGCWGPEATAYASSTLLGARVVLIPDPGQDAHDRYGRTLSYVEKPGGWDYSVEAVRSGAGKAYVYGHTPPSRAPQIAAAEQQAKSLGRGLWGSPCWGRTDSVRK